MNLRDIRDLVPFLNYLSRLNFEYRIEHNRDETLMVEFSSDQTCFEIDFFDDHIEYSVFVRDGAATFDLPWLLREIRLNV